MYVSADQMSIVTFNVLSCFCCEFVYLCVLWLLRACVLIVVNGEGSPIYQLTVTQT